MEVGSMPEQRVDSGIIEWRCSQAQLPSKLQKGEISAYKGDERSGDFHRSVSLVFCHKWGESQQVSRITG